MVTIDLGDVTDSSIEIVVNREYQKEPLTLPLNPDTLTEIYSDKNYRELKFETLEQR